MKTKRHLTTRSSLQVGRSQDGMAVIVVMIFIALVLIYLAANIRTLHNLGRELRMIEQQQTRRLSVTSGVTNNPASTKASLPKSQP
jgi:hypothetical protein